MTVCKTCNGLGKIKLMPFGYICTCAECKGTGETRDYMTNEEWLRSATTEQLAEYLADKFNEVVDFVLHEVDENSEDIEPDDYWYRQDVIVEWLKQPHS